MQDILPTEIRFMGTHPMFGPDSAGKGVTGFPIVVCPQRVPGIDAAFWTARFEEWGLRVLTMGPDEHDHQVAFTQGVTHFIGRVLGDLDLQLHPLSTLGFRKMLEVIEQTCNDPWQLFVDLQKLNPYTEEMRKRLRDSFMRIVMELEDSRYT